MKVCDLCFNIDPESLRLFAEMAEACKRLGEMVLKLLDCLKMRREGRESFVLNAREKLELVSSLAQTIRGSLQGESAETLADLLDGEMVAMDKAIEEAARRIEVCKIMCDCALH